MTVFIEFAFTLLLAFVATAFVTAIVLRLRIEGSYAIPTRAADMIFLIVALAYAITFGSLSILRHDSFHSGGFDVGIFDQVVWNSLHGRLFENSIRIDAPSFLAQHFSPLLLALVPLYALWSDPRALLIIQTIGLAVAALPIYWFARKHLGLPLALAVGFAYFLFPALQYVNLFEFHEIALATPLLSFAIYFLLCRRHAPFIACLMLALLAKEEVAFIVVALGVYLLFVQRQRNLGIGFILLGAAYTAAVFNYVMPSFFGRSYDANFFVMDRYLYLGKTIPEIITTIITQPGLVIQHLLVPNKIEFLLQLLIPLAFIPLVGGEVLMLTVPTLGYLLIGDYVYQNSIHYQYTAPLLPFLFFAAAVGLKRVLRWRTSGNPELARTTILIMLISVASIVNYLFQSAGPLAQHFDPAQYALNARTEFARQLIRQVPPNASVFAESNLIPHLSHRRVIYQAPTAPNLREIEYALVDTRFPSHGEYAEIWKDVLETPFLETIVDQDGLLLRKRATATITRHEIQFDARITLLGYTVESGEPARRGENARLILTWRADQNIRDRYVTFVHLIDAQNRIWAQDDHEPANGWFRTDRWNVGDITPDRFVFALPTDIPPGDYRITGGLYTTTDQKNLTARDASGNELGSEPVLGVLRVVAETQ